MLLEVVRIVSEALDADDIGVNKHIADLPRDSDDPEPPQVYEVLDSTRHPEVLEGDYGPNRPVIAVAQFGPATSEGEVRTKVKRRMELITISVEWVVGETRQARDLTDTLYVLRAIVKSLRDLLRNSNLARRQKNDITIIAAETMTWGPVEVVVAGGAVKGMVLVDFVAEDDAP